MMPSLMIGAKAWRCEQFQLSNVTLNITSTVTAGCFDKDEVFANLIRLFVSKIIRIAGDRARTSTSTIDPSDIN